MDRGAAAFYEEDGKDLDFYDFEPLPTLPEDEVSPRPTAGLPPPPPRGSQRDPQPPVPAGQVPAAGDPAAVLTAPSPQDSRCGPSVRMSASCRGGPGLQMLGG